MKTHHYIHGWSRAREPPARPVPAVLILDDRGNKIMQDHQYLGRMHQQRSRIQSSPLSAGYAGGITHEKVECFQWTVNFWLDN